MKVSIFLETFCLSITVIETCIFFLYESCCFLIKIFYFFIVKSVFLIKLIDYIIFLNSFLLNLRYLISSIEITNVHVLQMYMCFNTIGELLFLIRFVALKKHRFFLKKSFSESEKITYLNFSSNRQ